MQRLINHIYHQLFIYLICHHHGTSIRAKLALNRTQLSVNYASITDNLLQQIKKFILDGCDLIVKGALYNLHHQYLHTQLIVEIEGTEACVTE